MAADDSYIVCGPTAHHFRPIPVFGANQSGLHTGFVVHKSMDRAW